VADIIAETDRLILRTIEEGDAARQDRLLNTPAVMARLGGVKELHEIEAKHAKAMAMYAREGFSFLFMIEKASGEMVGHCGIKRGYAEEAMRAVLDWAFTRIAAPHIVALTSHANAGSWKLMQKLGMVRREDLDFADPAFPAEDNPTIQYSLTQEQWESAK
jgi:RimJ/RimL family protein N-acetyltransferase